LQLAPVDVGHDDIVSQHTGGTTGGRGSDPHHRNMIANVLQAGAWLAQATSKDRDIVITALPLYHIFSLTANCLVFMESGAQNILITNPRDFATFVQELKKYRFTYFSGVNTLFNALLHTPGSTAWTSASCPSATAAEWRCSDPSPSAGSR
jgi:long-chain acyl-CoA synthetase